MTRGQLAILPVREGRRADRRIVNLAARLRDPGAELADVDIQNLSLEGFMARGHADLEVGAHVWLKLSGLEPQSSRVIWVEEDKAGFQFLTPLHPAVLNMLTSTDRKSIPKGHFGVQGRR